MDIDKEIDKKISDCKNYGIPIFNEIFKLTDQQIIDKLESILLNDYDSILSNEPTIKRIIVNSIPNEITISFYDTIKIDSFGISYKPEQGPFNSLITFNKHFRL